MMSSERQFDYLANALTNMEAQMIDPREFGRLEGEVKALQQELQGMRDDVKQLLELANKSKGGFWMGMTSASFVGGIVTFIGERFVR
jgi:hypothetical protein